MSSNSSKKGKSSGLRMLWIPGRKSNPKGRYSATNKHVSYSPKQKKSEVWTLGGSRAQNELIDLPSPEITTDASTSSLALLGGMSSTLVKSVKNLDIDSHQHHHDNHDNHANHEKDGIIITSTDSLGISECVTLPTTPVAAITPNLNSPLSELAPSTPSTLPMTSPIVVTTVEIPDLHNILNPDDLPKVPSFSEATDLSTSAVVLNSSAGTTASIATNSSPLATRKANNNVHLVQTNSSNSNSSQNASPQKGRYRNHNNNQQDDINSIESVSSFNRNQVNTDFEWIDEMVQQRNCNELRHKNKRKKSHKKTLDGKHISDQLDGGGGACKIKDKYDDGSKTKNSYDDNDEKVVKCLYYSLMCCDCTIS